MYNIIAFFFLELYTCFILSWSNFLSAPPFDTVKVPMSGPYLSNRLHDKFCIIDLEYVMHGSYNWSKNARSNDETLETALDRDLVKKFSDEFLRLYVQHKQ